MRPARRRRGLCGRRCPNAGPDSLPLSPTPDTQRKHPLIARERSVLATVTDTHITPPPRPSRPLRGDTDCTPFPCGAGKGRQQEGGGALEARGGLGNAVAGREMEAKERKKREKKETRSAFLGKVKRLLAG